MNDLKKPNFNGAFCCFDKEHENICFEGLYGLKREIERWIQKELFPDGKLSVLIRKSKPSMLFIYTPMPGAWIGRDGAHVKVLKRANVAGSNYFEVSVKDTKNQVSPYVSSLIRLYSAKFLDTRIDSSYPEIEERLQLALKLINHSNNAGNAGNSDGKVELFNHAIEIMKGKKTKDNHLLAHILINFCSGTRISKKDLLRGLL